MRMTHFIATLVRVQPQGSSGTSQQRLHGFRVGLQHGSVRRCDTFSNLQP